MVTWVSRYQKGNTTLDLNEARDDGDGSGISRTIRKQSTSRFRQTITPTPHHSIFTRRMHFLMPNQQCQSTEGKQRENKKSQIKTIQINPLSSQMFSHHKYTQTSGHDNGDEQATSPHATRLRLNGQWACQGIFQYAIKKRLYPWGIQATVYWARESTFQTPSSSVSQLELLHIKILQII